LRSFIAVDISQEEIVEKLVKIQSYLKNTNAHMKLVEPENFHITLKFLGEISPSDVNLISNVLKKILADEVQFEISIEGIGAFPTMTKPRVVWVGIKEGGEALRRIANKITHELRKVGIKGDEKEFHPHVTLARIKRSSSDLVRILRNLESVKIGSIIVSRIRLKRSTLTPQGPIYSTIAEFPLKEI